MESDSRSLFPPLLAFVVSFLLCFSFVRSVIYFEKKAFGAVSHDRMYAVTRSIDFDVSSSHVDAVAQRTTKKEKMKTMTEDEMPRAAGVASGVKVVDALSRVSNSTTISGVRLMSPMESGEAQCNMRENTELWGDAVKWGAGNKKRNWSECCDDCRKLPPKDGKRCNIWVYCGDKKRCGAQYQDCWLKYERESKRGPTVHAEGPEVMWTSGSFFKAAEYDTSHPTGKKYHVMITSSLSIYQQWQARIFYYHYKKQKALHPDSDIGGFTRLLHSKVDDVLSEEMHTVRVDPLDNDGGYVVLSRPYAFNNFIAGGHLDKIEEEYILMAEPDHIFLRPLPNFVTEGYHGIGFPFFYIAPTNPTNRPLVPKVLNRTLTDDELASIDGTGNSPVIIKKDDFKRIAPRWHDLTMRIFKDKELKAAWGWVLEMWAYTLASHDIGVRHIMYPKFMCQPPWDTSDTGFAILHYTYGVDTDLKGNRILNGTLGQWRFDKRSYYNGSPSRDLPRPPDGAPELIKTLIEKVNEASANTPTWGQH